MGAIKNDALFYMEQTRGYKNAIKLIGKTFNWLTIIDYYGVDSNIDTVVTAECKCGNIKQYVLKFIKNQTTKSCGCLRIKNRTKHGLKNHPLYTVWKDMNARCYNKNNQHYDRYGGRGVSVSLRWRKDFKAFYDWAIDKWKPGLRFDKDIRSGQDVGDFYCPELCCFVTHKENMRKTSNNVYYEYNGERLCVSQLCEKYNIGRSCFNGRMESGWGLHKTLTTPVKSRI